jgi:hypothetical protein
MFLTELNQRNEVLFYLGSVSLVLAALFAMASPFSSIKVMGVNAWNKPFKFAVSIGVYSWTIAWIGYYLPQKQALSYCSWLIVVLLGFELLYIGIQSWRGQLSHYNTSTPLYAKLYILMAIAAAGTSVVTAYLANLFFQSDYIELSSSYLWGIRIGLFLFVIFSFEGFAMGSRMAHTIGAADGGQGWPLTNWSKSHGDLRVSHFLGMHGLQRFPLLGFYGLRSLPALFSVAVAYTAICLFTFFQALAGSPLITRR